MSRRRLLAAATAVGLAVTGLLGVPASPAYADVARDSSWHLRALKLDQVHRVTQGEGIVVAVIDTGVDPNHQDLVGNVLPGVDLTDPSNKTKGHRDATGHGTGVAALIAGHGHGSGRRHGVLGIAPKAKIMPFRVYDERVRGAPRGLISLAIRRAVDAGADVICVAMAGSPEGGQESAIRYAMQRGVVVVAGVGNSPFPMVQDPAAVPEALAVTGFDRDGKPITTVRGIPNRDIDIAAPGGDIPVAYPGNEYRKGTGTSAATAIVAGALALVLSAHPGLTRNQQVERIVWTADDMGEPGKDDTFGWGALNLVNAVSGEPRRPEGAPTPTPPPQTQAAGEGEAIDEGDSARDPFKRLGGTLGWLIVIGCPLLVLGTVVGVVFWVVRSRSARRPDPTTPG